MLTAREAIREGDLVLVTADRIYDLRATFSLSAGEDEANKLEHMCKLLANVLPPGALPFADDWAGNLYCLMLSGPYAGQVVYWDHERNRGDYRAEPLTKSIEEFYQRLVPDPREADV
jgi:hypothetical protein